MNVPDRSTVVAAWLRYAQTRQDEDFWAWDWVMCQAADQAPADVAWSLLMDLLNAVPDEPLGNVGVGPLEHMLPRFGPASIERIEQAAETDPRFREALAAVWLLAGDVPADIEARLDAASGGVIEPDVITPQDEVATEEEWERELTRQRDARSRQAVV